MAVANMSSQARQDKYSSEIAIAYGRLGEEQSMRILRLCQKNQGSSDHKDFIFYKEKEGFEAMTESRDSNGVAKNWDAVNKVYKDIPTEDTTDLITGVRVTPVRKYVKHEFPRDNDDASKLEADGVIIRRQKEAIAQNRLTMILTPIKSLIGAGLTRIAADNTSSSVTIPSGNVFGDDTKTFYDNEEAFFNFVTKLEEMGIGEGANSSSAILHGSTFYAHISQYDRAVKNIYISSSDIERTNKSKYAVRAFQKTELMPIQTWDTFMDVKKVVGILDKAVGFDALTNAKFETEESITKDTVLYMASEAIGATVVNEKGIYLFKYSGVLGSRVYKTEAVTVTP